MSNFMRDSYGMIDRPVEPYLLDMYKEAYHLIGLAVKKKKIPYAYDFIEFDRKGRADGYAVHHELYDVSSDARHVLMCCRSTRGNGKYGVSTTNKTYYLISVHGRGVRVVEAPKSKAAKAAKQASQMGDAIAVCRGKKKLQPAYEREYTTCYKITAVDEAGLPISVFDGSSWQLGKTRQQRATGDHTGGYYVFKDVETAIDVWRENTAFAPSWQEKHDKFVLLECECYGRQFLHNNGKVCVTGVRPVSVIASMW